MELPLDGTILCSVWTPYHGCSVDLHCRVERQIKTCSLNLLQMYGEGGVSFEAADLSISRDALSNGMMDGG